VQDILNTKKFGDIAFRDKDFKNAIEYYSKVEALSLFIVFYKSMCLRHFCCILLATILWLGFVTKILHFMFCFLPKNTAFLITL
jgi:hypothetical protein